MLAPGTLFAVGLVIAYLADARYAWLSSPGRYPWELWLIAVSGVIATLGGIGDWVYHRTFLCVGPREHHSHLLALASGGVPLFLLMTAASVVSRPAILLLPVVVVVLYTATLICFDEFVFHRNRCKPLETLMHRLLVFGNGLAWLGWMHWNFVRGGPGA
jgi:hypothetical protein